MNLKEHLAEEDYKQRTSSKRECRWYLELQIVSYEPRGRSREWSTTGSKRDLCM